jgi:hypothetical protein
MDVSAGRRELKSNVGELNQFLKTEKRQPVKEVILTDVNTIPAKITCLSDTMREQSLKEAMWSEVVVGKYKKLAHGRQEKTYSIPVIKNRYELPGISGECERQVCKTMGNQDVGKHQL